MAEVNPELLRAATAGGQLATLRRWLDDDVQAHPPPLVIWKGETGRLPSKDALRRIVELSK